MRTRLPISTINFGTPEYLKSRLDSLCDNGILTWYFFISHKPEDDEVKGKRHQHVWCQPAKTIDTDALRKELIEFDALHPDKPFKPLPFKSSKFQDAYMYFLHNKAYLAMKGQSRRFHYSHSDFVTNEPEMLFAEAQSIDLLSISPYMALQDAIDEGLTWEQYIKRGQVPIAQLNQFEKAWFALCSLATNRNGSVGHPMVDENGELVGCVPECES